MRLGVFPGVLNTSTRSCCRGGSVLILPAAGAPKRRDAAEAVGVSSTCRMRAEPETERAVLPETDLAPETDRDGPEPEGMREPSTRGRLLVLPAVGQGVGSSRFRIVPGCERAVAGVARALAGTEGPRPSLAR